MVLGIASNALAPGLWPCGLTFLGGVNPTTAGLWLTDIARVTFAAGLASNLMANSWLHDPTHVRPSSQVVWAGLWLMDYSLARF
jgi:hypothetical protein